MVSVDRLADVFVTVADTLVDDFDVIEFLQMVTTHTSELVSATAAGLLLADGQGRLQLMAASDERARMLELFQVQQVEGPCQDSFRLGTPVVNADLASANEKWPVFAPRAVEAGFRSVHAFPLRLRREVLGALNLFGDEAGRMQGDDVRVVQALADVATIGLLQERAIRRSELVTEQLQSALNSRVAIEQAKGALAQIHACSTDEAFELLRGWCRRNHQRLTEVARGLLSEPSRFPELTAPTRDR
jgi:transcriptional regulator with GAF, ATPase, and Fis domain